MSDPVNNPAHYKAGGLEAIDVIEAFELGFRLGNAVKYILRAGRKLDALEDLKKARWYLDREIAKRAPEAHVHRCTLDPAHRSACRCACGETWKPGAPWGDASLPARADR